MQKVKVTAEAARARNIARVVRRSGFQIPNAYDIARSTSTLFSGLNGRLYGQLQVVYTDADIARISERLANS